jgi:hypothetical protein
MTRGTTTDGAGQAAHGVALADGADEPGEYRMGYSTVIPAFSSYLKDTLIFAR